MGFTEEVVKDMEDRKILFQEKNAAYGDAWKKAGQILSIILPDGVKLEDENDMIFMGVMVRKIDKLVRAINLKFNSDVNNLGEKIQDTLQDDGVYSFMLATHERMTEGK